MLKTPLCSRLGIELPIFSAGMGPIAGPELVAAVSNAGGLESWAVLQCHLKKSGLLSDEPMI